MENKKYVIDDIFTIADYIGLTDSIANGFFSQGDYTPAYGRINAMRLFFNICVKESPFNFNGDVETDIEMDELIKSEDFLVEFDKALKTNSPYKLTFGRAYIDAMDIVESKKSGIGLLADKISSVVTTILNNINNSLDGETISRLERISQDISNGDFTTDNIVRTLGEKHFK